LILSSSYLPPDFKGYWAPVVAAGMLVKRVRAIIDSLRASKPWQGDTHWITESSLRTALADSGSLSRDVVAAEVELHEQRPEDRDANRTAAEAIASLVCLSLTPLSTRRTFDHVRCPTLVVHGKDDALVPPEWGEALARGRPNWKLVSLPGSGHPVHLTEPDRWVSVVGDWLIPLLKRSHRG
jgi:pimeloyl-ACP methyl ester carboxylesterase